MTGQPNFVLFITDQHRADYLGCYGHPILKTPNIDALASRGVRFDQFYSTSPVCMPNRASLMTGRMPSSHGVWTNGTPLSKDNVTFVELLRDAGYDTALIGKSHLQNFGPAIPAVHQPDPQDGFTGTVEAAKEAVRSGLDDERYQSEQPANWQSAQYRVPTPFYGFDHVDLVTGHGDGAGGDYGRWLLDQGVDRDATVGAPNQLDHGYICPQAVRTAVPEELYTTRYIAKQAVDWIAARASSDRPFFLMVSWPDPHHPFNPPGKYWDMYKPEEMDTPAAFAEENWEPPAFVQAAIDKRAAGKAFVNGYGSFACTEREALEARALTCGMIAMIDDAVGDVVNSLDAAHASKDTVVLFTADHGEHLGDHRLLLKGSEQYEQITRVPFIWSDPVGESDVTAPGLGQTHDIGVSILERARVQASWGMQGRPLSVVGGTDRDAALIQFDHQRADPILGDIPRVHTVRDRRFRLSIFDGVETGELYDLVADPDELHNLWADPHHSADRARMTELLARLEIANSDRAPLPRGLA